MLSKSKYTRGMNCKKSLWLYVHKKNEQLFDDGSQFFFNRGYSVGELAQQFFPDGKMAVLDEFPSFESAKRTQDFIKQGVNTIYEATFIYNDTLIAVDILHKHNGKWGLYEVKSTNSVKPKHIKDIAIQYFVVNGCGLNISNVFIMHLNREYVRHRDIDVNKLFVSESVLDSVLPLQLEIPNNISSLNQMLNESEPTVEMGEHCNTPYSCDFKEYCSSLLPIVECEHEELSNTPEIMQNEVKVFVDSIKYPICHLDFETIMPAVPMFDESRPYQQIPFQYSLHYQETKNSELKHTFYLAESKLDIDPRKDLIKQMIKETENAKTIFVYNIAFERTRINEMSRDFPEYSKDLENISERLEDLIIPFRKKYYRTETMEGSSSIKKVLPALCPELSYTELEIGNGMAASNAFLDLYYCEDENLKEKTRENLLKYCHLDTLAMVKILEVLQKV